MKTTLDLIKQIIDNEMDMPEGRVFAYNASQNLPQDSNLFIVLSYMMRTPYSSNSEYKSTNDKLTEKQSVNLAEDVIISLVSKNNDARDRSYEVAMALRSQFSQQIQDKYHCHISWIGECIDASFLEYSARLNRFDIRCTVFRAYTKEKDVDYYDKFPISSKFEPEWHVV